MAESSSSRQDAFDIRKIRRLVELMNEHDLTEVDLRQADMRIQIRRNGTTTPLTTLTPPIIPTPVQTTQPAEPLTATAAARADTTVDTEEHIVLIKSPMVGTFYSASDPDNEPYAKVGDLVSSDTTVCIVEAMKVFNEIQAETAGKVVAVLVENGEPVEFGHPLFKVDTRP